MITTAAICLRHPRQVFRRLTRYFARLLAKSLVTGVMLFGSQVIQATEPDEDYATVTVMEPYIELHTGPGRGYPVFHVIAGGEPIQIIKRRTNWFLVQSSDRHPVQGWVKHEAMTQTATRDAAGAIAKASFPGFTRDSASPFRWTVSGGDFSGAAAISTALAYRMTSNLQLELAGTQILGDFSDGKMITASIAHYPFPNWRASPYFQIGAGVLQTEPSATLVQAEDRTDNTLLVGGGVNVYLGRRFNLFLDYRRHTVLTSRDNNEEIDEWKLGFNVSF